MMIIPYEELEPDTLQALIEEFVTRDGTDYGMIDVSLDTKVKQVISQLKDKQVVIVYSELHETVTIVPSESLHNISE